MRAILALVSTLVLCATLSGRITMRAHAQQRHHTPKFTHAADTVFLAFAEREWPRYDGSWPSIPDRLFLQGDKRTVDKALGALAPAWNEWSDIRDRLGEGKTAYGDGGASPANWAEYFKDRSGTRFIAFYEAAFHDECGQMILSRVSQHAARRVTYRLSSERTPSGVGIATTRAFVLRRLGSPSRRYTFGPYELLFYFETPKTFTLERTAGAPKYQSSSCFACALREGHVVELLLQLFSNEPVTT